MRFMIIVRATKDSEAGVMPSEELLTAMGKYNEELVKAGIMQAGEGLHPSSKGARVRFSGKQRIVIDGPFAETKELIAGFWIWQVKSRDEAIEWVKRCPNPMPGDSDIEIRQIFEAEDFGKQLTPELREQEQRLANQIEAQKVKPIPDGMHTVTPHLICKGAADAIEFYKKAFGAVEEGRLPGPNGLLMHAIVRIAGSPVMLVDEMPQWGALGPNSLKGSPVTIHLYVPDADAFFAKAVAAGAKVKMPLEDQFWGDRYGKLEDPFGHHWSVATHRRDVTPQEMQQAMQKMGS
jgi:uncharacterized glyoxalase superfamily protein PhnB